MSMSQNLLVTQLMDIPIENSILENVEYWPMLNLGIYAYIHTYICIQMYILQRKYVYSWCYWNNQTYEHMQFMR